MPKGFGVLELAIVLSFVLGVVLVAHQATAQPLQPDATVTPVPTLAPFDARSDVRVVPFAAHYPGAINQHAPAGMVLSGFANSNGRDFAIIRLGDDDENLYGRDQTIDKTKVSLIDPSHSLVKLANGTVLHVEQDIGSVLSTPAPANPNPYVSPGNGVHQ